MTSGPPRGSQLRSDPTPRPISEFPFNTSLHHLISDLRTLPLFLICPPFHIPFSSIALTLPYLLFPAFPSVMPVLPALLISDISGHTSDPSGLSLYIHNTYWTWKVLCSLFEQTSSYISSTTPVCFLSSNLDLSST